MRKTNSGNKFGGRKSFGDRDSGEKKMYRATCFECGQPCEVPFKPIGDKPVFCSHCFGNKERGDRGGSNFSRGGGRSFGRPSFGAKNTYRATCSSCGANCEVPFKPSGDRPVYCNACFKNKGDGDKRGGKPKEEQFDILNAKLDKIIKALSSSIINEPAPKEKAVKKIKESKPQKAPKTKKVMTKKKK